MKQRDITINMGGTTDIDLKEGFSGMSCVEKSKQIELIIGGTQVEQKEKPEYYEPDTSVHIYCNIHLLHNSSSFFVINIAYIQELFYLLS